ncbi:Hsp33 family molecular chaperone HslO [Pseudoteredinibacter isoporae]|uniref:Molecular chaperone Hsp33 n=1 Tax=Pseudoteredinibacter isoporae TaxID=570281 RepID=A0A7X0JSM4_9GAMM|nr:Hsp33 family molecular chaperone HslO [Pseudoteredinibacter isoporae]MBB6520566.1 molecular chaperone Hsp33 [Pseudoteredinibacter isoporae]NHO86133.1 Hsp33 family molecular chaperone HslO [Pseudoteredinibacter isoporae]NIB25416.1 Hsp33 family molecular chaperone HslO [Pseudoteredinibacter isoporae]
MANTDSIQHFIFDSTDIRGEIITLEEAYQQVRNNNMAAEDAMPERVLQLLGEFMAAVALLSGTLKFEGLLTLQARGDGAMPMIMAEASYQKGLRAAVQVNDAAAIEALESASLADLLGNQGLLAILIQPDKGERYQGIVPLVKTDLAECLEDYFAQSEQLGTRFWLAADEKRATGLMVQELPQQLADAKTNAEHWQTITALAETIKDEELLSLDQHTILYRLFNEEEVRLFDPVPVSFQCSCSEERCANTILSIGQSEAQAILSEQDLITMDCHFCGQKYQFGPQQVEKIFAEADKARH